jgi:prohibitin 1
MKLLKISAILVTTVFLNACGFEQVDTGHRGIKTTFGEVVGEPLGEGLHFYNPLTSSIREYAVRENNWSEKTPIFTKDTQRVDVDFTVVYYPDPKFVTTLFKDIGSERDLVEKIIKPVVLGSIKDSIGEVIADELVSKRENVTKAALARLKATLADRHVFVTGLEFTNLDFDDQYEKAVEEKVVAIQLAQKAVNESVQIAERAKQTVQTATAEARAMQIKSQALAQNKGLVEFEAVQKWDGHLPQNVFGNQPLPFVDLHKLGGR